MGNHSRIEGYLSELIGKPKIKLEDRDWKFLIELEEHTESIYSMHAFLNSTYEFKIPSFGNNAGREKNGARVVTLTKGPPLSRSAVRKRLKKFIDYGLIEEIKSKKRLTSKERFAANLHRSKPFRISEYGLFCILSQPKEGYPLDLFQRNWQRKVMKLLLSSYFEKKTFASPTVEDDIVMMDFFLESLRIVKKRLSWIENPNGSDIIHEKLRKNRKGKKSKTWKQEQIRQLEDDLMWHAKSFALRLMADIASKDKDKRQKSRRILSFLAQDKKFVKLVEDAMHEILSYYRGGRLLELDKARPYGR